jgi:acyl-coenzyme A thioesterase PaaI-like protein
MNRIVRALESPRAARLLFNTYPPYLMTGIRVVEVSPDWRRVIVRMGLHWYNRNYFGTQFGGSLYAMTDPFYAIMLVRNLGLGHIVWDRAARIEFLRPGRGAVWARFELTQQMIDEARDATEGGEKYHPEWPIEIRDDSGELVARVVKTLYVRRKQGR